MDEVTEQPIEVQAELGLTEQAVEQPTEESAKAAAFDVDGEQVTVDQIKQWKQGHLMQSDYTRKTQELSQRYKPYEEMDAFLQANPDKAQNIYNYLQGQPLVQQEVDPRDQKITQLERDVNRMMFDNSRKEAQTRIEAIKGDAKYGAVFKDPVMEELLLSKALQTKDYDLKSTAEQIYKVVNDLKATTKIETEKTIQSNLSSPTRKGGVTKSSYEPPKGFDPSKVSSRELDAKALDMLS
jgi:hypothetical protein